MQVITKVDIIKELQEVGLKSGDVVMVHTSLKSMGYICGGAQAVIEALLAVVGKEGTVMMPTQSWKNLGPEEGVHWLCDEADWQVIRENWPAYDKNLTPTNTMGAVAEMFRMWPGSIRSDHPARSVCANGKYADYLTKNHDLSNIFGKDSPIDRLYELDAKVLLLGVGYDKNTSIHLADAIANYDSKHDCVSYSAVMENGERVWKKYETLFVDGEDFEEIGDAFEKDCADQVVIGQIGDGKVRLMRQRAIVDYAVNWIEANRI